MINTIQIGLMLILTCFFYSCNMSDSKVSIFGEYVYFTESATDHAIVGGKNDIPPDVVAYIFDSKFLIAKQKPFVEVLIIKKANAILDKFDKNELNHSDSLFIILKQNGADGSFTNDFKAALATARLILPKEDTIYNKYIENPYLYWILIRSTDRLIGPLTKSEFKAIRKELEISDKLEFD